MKYRLPFELQWFIYMCLIEFKCIECGGGSKLFMRVGYRFSYPAIMKVRNRNVMQRIRGLAHGVIQQIENMNIRYDIIVNLWWVACEP